ncbi:hypothetical protein DL766_001670 [Monosporascus sp. MC13-8B]|uniref:Uncharacterized protein n=1 Tax=Monosporascus cannonballus TaxID=155416 RepID=A0ABY0H4T8_9PEZI|nr:hypothetical protein DL762_005437 [Monosporascus cannonballus]RYO91907.1 hypothetical protein DL763_004845 [Monosporascus cannonballus]RYP37096.1 hypothetical protein DL766_001670 [Monosporascus sp. MC13-8B]
MGVGDIEIQALSRPGIRRQWTGLRSHNAVRELERVVTELGCLGALIDNHLDNGTFYEGPAFRVFWANTQELDVPECIHPTVPEDRTVFASTRGPTRRLATGEAVAKDIATGKELVKYYRDLAPCKKVAFSIAEQLLLKGGGIKVKSVAAQTVHVREWLPPVDTVDAALKLDDGATDFLSKSFGSPFDDSETAVAGEKDTVSVDGNGGVTVKKDAEKE